MDDGPQDTVLLVCGCPALAPQILEKLYEGGVGVVGPAATAGLALTLAAQTQPTVALIASPPSGRRDASALGRELMTTWGVRSWVLEDAQGEGAKPAPAWAADPKTLPRLRRALERTPAAELTPAA